MKLHELAPAPGSRRDRRRVARGRAGKGGKTAGRGTKGAGARSQVTPHYEGGQMPIQRRVPKQRGFKPWDKVEFAVVNLDSLATFDPDSVIDPEALRSKGLVRKKGPVKVLGRGEIGKPLMVKANAFSGTAVSKIEAAGGSVQRI